MWAFFYTWYSLLLGMYCVALSSSTTRTQTEIILGKSFHSERSTNIHKFIMCKSDATTTSAAMTMMMAMSTSSQMDTFVLFSSYSFFFFKDRDVFYLLTASWRVKLCLADVDYFSLNAIHLIWKNCLLKKFHFQLYDGDFWFASNQPT